MMSPAEAISPVPTDAGKTKIRVGAGYARGEWRNFDTADADRTLYTAPDIAVLFGVSGNAELILRYSFMFLKQGSDSIKAGTGDLNVTALYDLCSEAGSTPGIAFLVSAKLPNAHYLKGFGTDMTDFYAGFAASRQIGRVRLMVNAGMGILGYPGAAVPTQDDVLVYDGAAVFNATETLRVGCELSGVANSRYGNERGLARIGLAWDTTSGTFDVSGGAGLTKKSGGLHVSFGWSSDNFL